MGWLGLDDTDHLSGGCTTHALFELLQSIPSNYEVQSHRLVRLYPFASRRTRGNAAVAVEIIGEDEPYQLDPETIYFITSLLNKMDLIKIRNKVLISALPQRV